MPKFPIPSTREEAEIYEIFQDMILKTRITNVFLVVFIIVALFFIATFIIPLDVSASIISGTFGTLLSPTVYKMSSHYFGAIRRARGMGNN